VRAFHAAAVGLGAESLHASRLWPEYHPGYSVPSCAIRTATTSKRCGTVASSVVDMGAASDAAGAARELLRDAFTRLIEHVDELTDGLTDETSNYQPTPGRQQHRPG